ncbi:MAG: phage holin family protein [Glaciihabitans sp.]|nr:phage holin family protein [Glaciihabitans sp.]
MTDPSPSDKAAQNSLGELLSEVSRDFSTLMRQEVELAKAELRDSAKKAGRGGGMVGGAAIAAHMALLFLSIALWWGLGDAIGRGWSALIVAVIYAIAAAILAVVGRRALASIRGLPQTADTVKQIPNALKPEE